MSGLAAVIIALLKGVIMMGKDIIIMSQRELKKLHVIRSVIERRITQISAGEMLDRSDRQVRRIVKRVKAEGDVGIIHRLRGKPSNKALPISFKDKVRQLYRDKYSDFGPLLASEKLFEIDKIKLSDETLRLWLLESGDWKKRKKGRKHRKWRERKRHFGEMLQGDGSHHNWFEGRGPCCVMMGYIDDATGNVYARFYEYEGTWPAVDSFKRYVRKYGLPQSLYMDNHSTYRGRGKPSLDDELAGRGPLSHFERGVVELGVNFIHADSPQAKGRIERLFKTFQDRLVKEMRLAGVRGIEDGNKFLEKYLPVYNKRFRVEPAEKADMHRPLSKGNDLDAYLCKRTERTLRNDFTVAYGKKLCQVISLTRAKRVIVEERITGRIIIRYNGKELEHRVITNRPVKEVHERRVIGKTRPLYTPPNRHPWRGRKWISYPQSYTYQQKEKSSKKEKGLLLVH